MTNNKPLFSLYLGYRANSGGASYREVFAGETLTLKEMPPGTIIELDGQRAALANKHRKAGYVRFEESQDVILIPLTAEAVVLDCERYTAGVPRVGDFVKPRVGTYAEQIGVVVEPGVLSTHVVFPGVKMPQKFNAKNLIIVKGARIIEA